MGKLKLQPFINRLRTLVVVTVLALGQVVFAVTPYMHSLPASAVAAVNCVNDTAGPNDVPGQKDLTKLCVDYSGAPATVNTTWNWDDTGTSGKGNTLDACNLFDTNGDGNINYSVCVSTVGDPATFQTLTTYSCGDDKSDRCTSPISVVSSGNTACDVSQQDTDPFSAGSAFPTDTQGNCVVDLSTVGDTAAKLIDVCSYPSSEPNSDPSDCVVAQPKSGKLQITKHLIPASDPGLFNLQVDGQTAGTGANVGDTGTTGVVVVGDGNHAVGETEGTNTSLAGYTSSIECRDLNGTGSPVASGSGTSLPSVPIADGSDVLCTITNTRQTGSITLNKVVTENNGGTAGVNDFGLSIGGTSVTSGQTLTLNPDSYAINEAGKTGYAFVSITGTGCPSTLGGNVTLAADQNITCTITNDDIAPTLTVVKNVTNDNGGTATANNFALRVDNTQLSGGTLSNSDLTDTYTYSNPLANVAYAVSEDSFTGYSSGAWSCTDNATNQSVANPVTLALGQNVTCSVTNNDSAPTLTLVKHVTNDNGGANTADQWTLKAQHSADTPVINAAGAPSNNGTVATTSATSVNANTSYALSESGPTGYSPSSWGCTGGVLTSGAVTLGVGENVTCTITNDDIAPKLTVIKTVTNNDGGALTASSFPLFVGSTQVTSGTQTTFNAGQYTVSETQQSGYTLDSITGNCLSNGSITMVVGGVYSCTLTNNDVPATITVTKVVNKNHGGTAGVSDFNLFVGATQVTSGISNTFAANHQYTVSELAQVNGYHQDSLVCTDTDTHADLTSTFTPTLAEHIACTITNSDIAPQLTVIKHVVNDNGGQSVTGDFTMHVTGTNVSPNSSFAGAEDPGTTVTLNAGSYGVDESVFAGYAKTLGQNCSGTIALGEQKICVITNDDIAPTLTVVKNVVNDNGGNNTANSFAVKVNGTLLTSGTLSNSNLTDTYTYANAQANTAYTVSEDSPTAAGYAQSGLVCTDNDTRAVVANPATLSPGQNVTCVITNNDVAPTLTVVKNVTNDDGGTATADDFSLRVNGSKLTGGTLSNSNLTDTYTYSGTHANTAYTVSEDAFSGYAPGSWACTDNDTGLPVSNPATLNEGQNVTCIITNNDVAPTITVNKVIDPTTNTGKFNLSVNGNVNSTTNDQGNGGTTGAVKVTNGSYTVSETAGTNTLLADYSSTYSCDNGTTGIGTSTPSFSVGSGDNVICTFYNTRLGSITIIKSADPQSFQEFIFTGNLQGTDTPNFTLVDSNPSDPNTVPDSNQKVFNHLTPSGGSYTFGEPGNLNHLGWTLDDILCSGSVDSKDVHNRNVSLRLSAGQNVICTFYNSRDTGTVTVNKTIESSSADTGKFNLNVNGETNYTATDQGDGGTTGAVKVSTGSYTVSETAGTDTNMKDYVSRYSCSNEVSGTGTTSPSFDVGKGDAITCTFTNSRKATVIVTKYNDLNHNGVQDSAQTSGLGVDEPSLPGWEITLGEMTPQTTAADGTTTFSNIVPGSYSLDETSQAGWTKSNITCFNNASRVGTTEDDGYYALVAAGDTIHCFIGNYHNVVLNLSKSVDRPAPLPNLVRDVLTYSLIVSLPVNSGASFDTEVTDLPPANIAYLSGSWTAVLTDTDGSTVDLKDAGITTEPTYGSPGVWKLGTLLPGQFVTLTYRATIGLIVSPGTYPDLAFVKSFADPTSTQRVVGSCVGSSCASTDPNSRAFVSTAVAVVSPAPSIKFAGQVLGASVLVNTGQALNWLQFFVPATMLTITGLLWKQRTSKGANR